MAELSKAIPSFHCSLRPMSRGVQRDFHAACCERVCACGLCVERHALNLKAQAVWKMTQYLRRQARSAGKQLLLVNMDETHVLCHEGRQTGTIAQGLRIGVSTPKSKRKKSVTYVALIANIAEAQTALTQYVLANEQTFRKQDMLSLAKAAGCRLHLVRYARVLAFSGASACIVEAEICVGRYEILRLDDQEIVLRVDRVQERLHDRADDG